MFAQLALFAVYAGAIITTFILVPSARLGLGVGLALGGVAVILSTLHAARYRLPDEGWAHWWKRVMQPKSRKGWERYYCKLECEHYAQIHSSRRPIRDEVAWCPAHFRTHALQTRVALVNQHAGLGVRTVTGVALDEDLIPDW